MEGFGNISTKNINELIKKIEQRIALITKNIDKNIQKAILDYSLKYVINGNRVLNHNKYIISLKFCTDFV